MPEELFPSSYRCDCGHESHFSEGTVREAKKMSRRKEIRLGDAAPDEHVIMFHGGEMIEIRCPHQQRSRTTKGVDHILRPQIGDRVGEHNGCLTHRS
jgi:hypothetical protein